MFFSKTLDWFHRLMSRLTPLVGVVIKIRNQCNAIIRYRLNDGTNPVENGESLVAKIVGEKALTFIDVGANVGNWSTYFLEVAPHNVQGLLFEPSDYAVQKLNCRFADNQNLKIIQACVADEPGIMIFYEEPKAGESSSLIKKFANSGAVEKKIQVTTINVAVEQLKWDYIDFLKIDTEGYDLNVIRGASRLLESQKIGVLQFEYNLPWKDAGSTLSRAISLLNDCGYEVFLLKGTGLYKIRYDIYGEYFSYSNFIAVSPEFIPILTPLIQGSI